MKRASYKEAIEVIALNDCPGDNDDFEFIRGYCTVLVVSAIFDVPQDKVANDVLKFRAKEKEKSK